MNRLSPLMLVPLFAAPAVAQTCLLTEGGDVPGAPGVTASSLSNTAVNQVGGYAVSINCSDGLARIWGSADGGDGAPLQTEATYGTLEQTGFESFFGFDDFGDVCYGPTVTDTATATTGLDSVWFGSTVLAQEDEPIPSLAGKVWRFASRPGVTGNGIPYWVGGINDAGTGATEGNGLFVGTSAAVVYKTGDFLTGAPAALGANAVDFDVRFSALGTSHITVLGMDLGSSEDGYMAMNGDLLMIDGLPVREGGTMPAAAGGAPGELWDNFDFLGVTDAGDYMITGDTDGIGTATDEFILRNGVVVYREGDVVDGATLTGAMEGAYMNANGEIAYIWDIDDGAGGSLEALFIEDKLLLVEGDPVDLDGDGTIDPGATISGFTGISVLTIGANRRAYFTADVDTLGTSTSTDDTECLLVMRDTDVDFSASPPSISVSTGGTQNLFLCAPSEFAGEMYWVLGSVSGTAPGIPIGVGTLPVNPDFYFNITLAKPNQLPLVDTLANLDADASAVAQFSLGASGATLLVGLSVNHAYAVVDPILGVALYASQATGLTLLP